MEPARVGLTLDGTQPGSLHGHRGGFVTEVRGEPSPSSGRAAPGGTFVRTDRYESTAHSSRHCPCERLVRGFAHGIHHPLRNEEKCSFD